MPPPGPAGLSGGPGIARPATRPTAPPPHRTLGVGRALRSLRIHDWLVPGRAGPVRPPPRRGVRAAAPQRVRVTALPPFMRIPVLASLMRVSAALSLTVT